MEDNSIEFFLCVSTFVGWYLSSSSKECYGITTISYAYIIHFFLLVRGHRGWVLICKRSRHCSSPEATSSPLPQSECCAFNSMNYFVDTRFDVLHLVAGYKDDQINQSKKVK